MVSTEANHYAYYYYYNVPEGEAYADDVHDDVDRARAGGGGGQGADLYHSSAHERDFTHSANIGTIITICNILLNLLLVALILARRSTRLQFVYQQVLNLAMSDLAFSVVVDPFSVYFDLQPWRLARGFCVAWMVLDCALPFVSFLALITLNADRLVFAISPGLYRRACSRRALRATALLLPWLLGLGLLVPLWVLSAVIWPRHGLCMYGITKTAATASAVISLYLPCVALIVLTVLVVATVIGSMPHDLTELTAMRAPVGGGAARDAHVPAACQWRQLRERPERLLRDGSLDSAAGGGVEGGGGAAAAAAAAGEERSAVVKGHRRLVVALCVLNLLTVIMQLPYGAISMLEPQCVETSCQSTILLLQALSWMRSLTFSLQPFCLLTLTAVRHACCPSQGHLPQGGDARHSLTTHGGSSKSDHIELASVNTANASNKGPPTLV